MIDSLATWFADGGKYMWVILAVLAVGVAVVFERMIFYYVICAGNGRRIVADIAKALNDNRINDAKAMVTSKAPLQSLLRIAVDRYSENMSIDEIQEGVEELSISQVPRFTKRLNYLALFANIATLVGLLGTISGLQLSFSSLVSVEASKKAAMLAKGISEFMTCTAFGLIVAVFCMVCYTFLSNKQNQLIKDLDESVVKCMNYLKKKRS
ncbi:MAG: MotA/TolQ/ExbB proton channel family protein [Fibrobacterota bacterium]|jgi:biopolymer transport protein ExbB/TolQ|nr:MotA/TolQ/ExbB proton channel family protein [Chitinispirillaceae bacterium]